MKASRAPVSLLVTLVIAHVGVPARSVAATEMVTGTRLWFGAQITSGEAAMDVMTGRVVSTARAITGADTDAMPSVTITSNGNVVPTWAVVGVQANAPVLPSMAAPGGTA